MNSGIYIHIPFCTYRCPYCDFFSLTGKESFREKYVNLLVKEAKLRSEGFGRPSTIYLGGGTPSLLEPTLLDRLLTSLDKTFDLSEVCEITIEANPETLDLEKLKGYRDIGVNRISIGVQSFSRKGLRVLGRLHSRGDSLRSIEMARTAGFENINIDLIWGWEGQSLQLLKDDLSMVREIDPVHVSFYLLTLHPHSELKCVDEDEVSLLYSFICEELADMRYTHYEISNWAKPGFECFHNLIYWRRLPFIGLGTSAWGFTGGVRYQNLRNLRLYEDFIQKGKVPTEREEIIGPDEELEERIFLGLRTMEGVDEGLLKVPEHLWNFLRKEGGRIVIKEEFMILSNEIISQLLVYNSFLSKSSEVCHG